MNFANQNLLYMRFLSFFVLSLITLFFGSCIEIIDDLTIKTDGTGSFKYTVNLSSSKTRINSILALDSLDGKKVPKIGDIKIKVEKIRTELASFEGLSNIRVEQDYSNFIFKISLDFKSLAQLQGAIKKIVSEEINEKNAPHFAHNWLNWTGKEYQRSFPELNNAMLDKLSADDREEMKKGSYSAITRFEKPVTSTNNPKAVVSPNKLNVLLKHSIYDCTLNQKLQEIVIQTQP
jgi:hypothetical protein